MRHTCKPLYRTRLYLASAVWRYASGICSSDLSRGNKHISNYVQSFVFSFFKLLSYIYDLQHNLNSLALKTICLVLCGSCWRSTSWGIDLKPLVALQGVWFSDTVSGSLGWFLLDGASVNRACSVTSHVFSIRLQSWEFVGLINALGFLSCSWAVFVVCWRNCWGLVSFNLSRRLLVFIHFNYFISFYFLFFYLFLMLFLHTAAMLLFYVKHFELFCTWNVLYK